MKKNLSVDHYRNGDPIPEIKDPAEWAKVKTGAWCYYFNDPENGKRYGKLYNWYAVSDPRGLAPYGQHIPSFKELKTLTDYLGGIQEAGKKLKSISGWKENETANNLSGFNALPGGWLICGRTFEYNNNLGFTGTWWLSTKTDGVDSFTLWDTDGKVHIGYWDEGFGLSVRCIKD
jgi:uncharacterized protein (TIGR02145 family)